MEENKEKYIQNSLEPVSIDSTEIILNQMKTCICKIHKNGIKGTGFFAKLPYKKDNLSVLITNNHILGENEIKNGKNISISLNNEKTFKTIKINSKRKRYTNEILDVTIIEIKEDIDNISDFLNLDDQILSNYYLYSDENDINCLNDIYKNESIYLLNYIKGKEIFASYGLLTSITESKINHKCNTDTGSSGSPIILLKNHKVIGVHYGSPIYNNFSFNFGTLILKPIIEFQQISNNNILVIKKTNILKKNEIQSNKIINEEKKLDEFKHYINQNYEKTPIVKSSDNKIIKYNGKTLIERFENNLTNIFFDEDENIPEKDLYELTKLSIAILIKYHLQISPMVLSKEFFEKNINFDNIDELTRIKLGKKKMNILVAIDEAKFFNKLSIINKENFMKEFREKYGLSNDDISKEELNNEIENRKYNEIEVIKIILKRLGYL